MRTAIALSSLAALLLTGCATHYQLTLMPRTSGKLYYGTATDKNRSEAAVTVQIGDKVYTGTWLSSDLLRTTGFVSAGGGWGRYGWGGVGMAPVSIDTTGGGEAKALLQAPDGSGLRCDLRGIAAGLRGTGTCQDDTGQIFDVQIRPAADAP